MAKSKEMTLEQVSDSPKQIEWLPMTEATTRLERSAKTLERLVAAGEVKSRTEPRAGRKPERLYHAGDIERIRFQGENGTGARGLSAGPRSAGGAELLRVSGETATLFRDVLERLADERKAERESHQLLEERKLTQELLRSKIWLSRREAAEYSGIPIGALRELMKQGRFVARRFGRQVRVLRSSLEAYQG